MRAFLTDNALFANFLSACLKLRLNQSHNLAVISQQLLDRAENLRQ